MALILYLIFLFVVVFCRVLYHYYLTGDHGIRIVAKDAPLSHRLNSLLLISSFVLSFSLCVIDAIVNQIVLGKYGLFGLLVGLTGIGFISISQYQMGRAWRIGVKDSEKTQLITHGIYAYIRNPIYTGVFLFIIGLLILLPNWLMLLAAMLAVVAIELQVRIVEEPYLIKIHGATFSDYLDKTWRYVPFY